MRSVPVILAIAGLAAPEDADKRLRARQIAEFQARCQIQLQPVVNRGAPGGPVKLTEAPPARMERAVNRRIFGCPVPILVPNGVEGK